MEASAMNGVKANKKNRERFQKICDMGCIICKLQGVFSICEIHHIDGSRNQEAHTKTIGLCYRHHREGSDRREYTSRHPHKKAFEKRYGTEYELLELTNKAIDVPD